MGEFAGGSVTAWASRRIVLRSTPILRVQDPKRRRLMAAMVGLVYNWWNLFVRPANPRKHHEAITSRPLLLHGVATKTQHGGQTTLTITSQHPKQATIQAVLTRVAAF